MQKNPFVLAIMLRDKKMNMHTFITRTLSILFWEKSHYSVRFYPDTDCKSNIYMYIDCTLRLLSRDVHRLYVKTVEMYTDCTIRLLSRDVHRLYRKTAQ
jgi:hypothetical protein